MERFKGTPGPWEFDKSSGKVKSETLDCVVDVCSSSVSPYDLDLDDKNGFLIASAPDLLESLQWAMNKIGGYTQRTKSNGDYCDAVDRARSAIARALGKNDGDK